VRKSVLVFPLWVALASGCALFDRSEGEGDRKELSSATGEGSAMMPTTASEVPTVEVAPPPTPRIWSQDDIRRMQRRLREVGLDPGPADGVAGARTNTALQKFHVGCGQVQPLLDTLENSAVTKAVASLNPNRQETVAMQTQLRQAGFNPGPVDGVFGAKTKTVLAELQSGCPMAKDFAQFSVRPSGAAQSTVVTQVAERANLVSAPAISLARARVDVVKPSIAPVAPHSQEEIRILQLRLRDAGFDPGPFDGVMGPKTQLALQQLQASQRAGKTKTALTVGLNGQY
jgi:peptidoglycan hydrolase-like protein with peptidoglycan-binding domain